MRLKISISSTILCFECSIQQCKQRPLTQFFLLICLVVVVYLFYTCMCNVHVARFLIILGNLSFFLLFIDFSGFLWKRHKEPPTTKHHFAGFLSACNNIIRKSLEFVLRSGPKSIYAKQMHLMICNNKHFSQ